MNKAAIFPEIVKSYNVVSHGCISELVTYGGFSYDDEVQSHYIKADDGNALLAGDYLAGELTTEDLDTEILENGDVLHHCLPLLRNHLRFGRSKHAEQGRVLLGYKWLDHNASRINQAKAAERENV